MDKLRKRKNVKIIPAQSKKQSVEPEVVSTFFSNDKSERSEIVTELSSSDDISVQLLCAFKVLNEKINDISFSPPVKYIYNPTEYAHETFRKYITSYGNIHKEVLFLGMNPGPWGMSQTGIPFGEVNAVKDWFKITGNIGKPPVESPDRPVQGLDCPRSEVSGKRFWTLAKELCDTPDNFFKHCFVYNYCPLQFIGAGGKNVTPDDLKIEERVKLNELCDTTLLQTLKLLNTKVAVGIGSYAEKRLKQVLKEHKVENIEVCLIPHPSPRAVGNTNWNEKALLRLKSLNLLRYFTK